MNTALVSRRSLACLATAHVVLIGACLWSGAGERGGGVLGGALQAYRSAAGLGADYSFFAPGVASAMRVGFVLDTPSGPRFEPLEPAGANEEVRLRVGCVVGSVLAQSQRREALSASLAALALGRNPDATAVTVVGQRHELPAPDAWLNGERGTWTTLFTSQFGRKNASTAMAFREAR